MTIDVAAGRFWLERGQYYRGNAKKTFKASLKWLVDRAGKRRISEMGNRGIADLVAARRGEGVSNATVNRTVTEPLRRVMLRARGAWDQFIPAIKWGEHLLAEPQERVRELRADEEARLLAALPSDYQTVVAFALLSGCRLAECVGLKWRDVDWGARRILIRGKGETAAHIPMDPEIRNLLWPLQGHDPEAVFTYVCRKTRGKRIRGHRYPITYEGTKTAWRRALPASGVTDFRFHDNRHTAATRLLRSSGNLKLVQKLLRHTEIATTTKYAHVDDDDLREAMEKSRTNHRTGKRDSA